MYGVVSNLGEPWGTAECIKGDFQELKNLEMKEKIEIGKSIPQIQYNEHFNS